MQSKKKITLSSSDSEGKWILWTYFNFPRFECYILKTVIHKDRLLMFSNSNLFHRHKSGHFFLKEFMNQIKFPLTCLSLHITIIMNMIQSQWIGTSHHGILFSEKDKVLMMMGLVISPATPCSWLWLYLYAGFVKWVVAGMDKSLFLFPTPCIAVSTRPSEWNTLTVPPTKSHTFTCLHRWLSLVTDAQPGLNPRSILLVIPGSHFLSRMDLLSLK